mmetsp:Transcript_37756/g.72331  ORF Transcript_37756/g.72331 Transcript_37756/m.72331 type:complete len:446 (-) Transcript_37756:645-1982(-)
MRDYVPTTPKLSPKLTESVKDDGDAISHLKMDWWANRFKEAADVNLVAPILKTRPGAWDHGTPPASPTTGRFGWTGTPHMGVGSRAHLMGVRASQAHAHHASGVGQPPAFSTLTLSDASSRMGAIQGQEEWFVRHYMTAQIQRNSNTKVRLGGELVPRRVSMGMTRLSLAGQPRHRSSLLALDSGEHATDLGKEWVQDVHRWAQAISRMTRFQSFRWDQPGRVGDLVDTIPKPALVLNKEHKIVFGNAMGIDLIGISLTRILREEGKLQDFVRLAAGPARLRKLEVHLPPSRDNSARRAGSPPPVKPPAYLSDPAGELFAGLQGKSVHVRHSSGRDGSCVLWMSKGRDRAGEAVYLAVFHRRPQDTQSPSGGYHTTADVVANQAVDLDDKLQVTPSTLSRPPVSGRLSIDSYGHPSSARTSSSSRFRKQMRLAKSSWSGRSFSRG